MSNVQYHKNIVLTKKCLELDIKNAISKLESLGHKATAKILKGDKSFYYRNFLNKIDVPLDDNGNINYDLYC